MEPRRATIKQSCVGVFRTRQGQEDKHGLHPMAIWQLLRYRKALQVKWMQPSDKLGAHSHCVGDQGRYR